MGCPGSGHPALGSPGMGRPPMGLPAGPRINTERDRDAAAAKMWTEFAKRAEAIKKKSDDARKTAEREKAARARFASGEKARAKATQKKPPAKKAQEKASSPEFVG